MVQEIYEDRVSVGCRKKFFILRNSLQHVVCRLFILAFHLAEVSVTFALCKHTIVAFCVEPCSFVGFNSNSLAAVRMDFIGERLNACFSLSMFSADVCGHPLLTASSINPVSINSLYHQQIEERDGGSFPYLVLYLCWVWTFDFVSMNQDKHCAFSWGVTIKKGLFNTFIKHTKIVSESTKFY